MTNSFIPDGTPRFDFNRLLQSFISAKALTPEFQQVILHNVATPSPVPTTDPVVTMAQAEPTTKGSAKADYPFSSLFEFPDEVYSVFQMLPNKDVAKLKILFETAFGNAKPDTFYPNNASSLPNTIFRAYPPIIKIYPSGLHNDPKGIKFTIQQDDLQGNSLDPLSEVDVQIYFIKGGMRVKLKFVDKDYNVTFPYTKKEVYGAGIDKKVLVHDILAKIYNHIWNTYTTLRNSIFNVDFVKKTLVSRSSVLDDDDTINEVIASKVADSLVMPISNVTIDNLDVLPLGTVLSIGDYVLAKYSTSTGNLYNVIDKNTGNYTNQAFDEFNLELYAKGVGALQPKILIDPNESPDIMSIISQYNMLYPAMVLEKALQNFQLDAVKFEKTPPNLTYSIGDEVLKDQALSVAVAKGKFTYLVDSLGEKYVIKDFGNAPNRISKETSLSSLKPQALDQLFNGQTLKWLAFNVSSSDTLTEKLIPISSLSNYFYTGMVLKKLFDYHYQSDDLELEVDTAKISEEMKRSYIWSKQGASINLVIGGFGAYAILIDKKEDGTPFYMVQYLKNNTSVFRMVLSNQTDPSNGKPYWVNYSTDVNGVKTATSQDDVGNDFIPYNEKYAMPSIDDAIKMIVTHLIQTGLTGFPFWEKANLSEPPKITAVVQAYYFGNANNWSLNSVTIPSKIEGIVCGALLVVPKAVGQTPKVFLVQQNGKWSIPMMNLTVGEAVEDCAMDAVKSMFSTLPKKIEFSGASLSSTLKSDQSTIFHTVILQVSEFDAVNWEPSVVKGTKISGYAWANASDLIVYPTSGDIQWKPTVLDELSEGQQYNDPSKMFQTSIQSVLGAWKAHSDQWKQSAPIDPRLKTLVDPVNIEQIKKFDPLYFGGEKYPFLSPPQKLFTIPDPNTLIPIEQRIAGYKSNPRRTKPKSVKLRGYRRNGLGSVLRYADRSYNHLIRLNPRKKSQLSVSDKVLSRYEPVVKHVFGVKNPSRNMLEQAYALEQVGLPLQDAKRNPKDNSVMTLNLDEVRAVVQFADLVKLASEKSSLLKKITNSQHNRVGTGSYDSEYKETYEGSSLPQYARYIPLFRVLGLFKDTLDIGERVVTRTVGTSPSGMLGGKATCQPNVWSYAQLQHLKQHFPNEVSALGIGNDLKNSSNFQKAIGLWLKIQSGKLGNKVFVRTSEEPKWDLVDYTPVTFSKAQQSAITKLNVNESKTKKPIPKEALNNPAYHIEGFWVDYCGYTYKDKTHTGFSGFIQWSFGGSTFRFRSNTRDPRFTNLPGISSTGANFGYKSSEREVMFVYPDKTPLTLQIISLQQDSLTLDQMFAWAKARPPHRKAIPKGKFSEFISKI